MFLNNVLASELSLFSLHPQEVDYSRNIQKFSWIDNVGEDHDTLLEKISKLDKKLFSLSGERGTGGGGDIALCKGHDETVKTYSLDYILRNQEVKIKPLLYQAQSCGGVIKEVYARLVETDQILAAGLMNFLKDFELSVRGNFLGRKRVFHFSEGRLVDINDEVFETKSLRQCQVKQAAIRLPFPQFIHYSINLKALNLLKQSPIQCSYFLLHEWARDFYVNAAKIREFVHFIHSESFFNTKVSLLKNFEIFEGYKESSPSTKNYFKLVGELGNLSFTSENLHQRLKSYEGRYKPLNEKDCQKSLRVKKNKVFISHLYNCSDPTEVMFLCKGATCAKRVAHPECRDFELILKLKGVYGHFSIGAKCDGKKLNLEHEYYHENQAKEFESFLELMDLR